MKNIFDKIEDAPPPSDELQSVYVGNDGWLIHYIAREGKWIDAGRVYPASLD